MTQVPPSGVTKPGRTADTPLRQDSVGALLASPAASQCPRRSLLTGLTTKAGAGSGQGQSPGSQAPGPRKYTGLLRQRSRTGRSSRPWTHPLPSSCSARLLRNPNRQSGWGGGEGPHPTPPLRTSEGGGVVSARLQKLVLAVWRIKEPPRHLLVFLWRDLLTGLLPCYTDCHAGLLASQGAVWG